MSSSYSSSSFRIKATFHDSTSTNYTYDAGNRLTQVQEKDSGGSVTATITRTYDGLDRLTQEVTPQGQVDYTYDNASRRTSMTVAGQTAVSYTYDNANRLTQVQRGGDTVTLAYDDADRRTSVTYPNGNKIEYAYDAGSQMTSLTYKDDTTTLGDLTYTYDAAGNRTKIGGSFARTNLPPALSTVSYNANNQQTAFAANTLAYDLNGNLLSVTDGSNTTTYTWNARNQLTGISGPGLTVSFTYDSFGRRAGKIINSTATNFVYDGLNPVQEKDGSTVTANLLTGLGIDEFFTRADGVGSRALLTDVLGSTVALGDNTGALQTEYTYEPFGFTTQTGQANANSYKFTGREEDGSGLYYYRARYYHPRLQRFISEDPIGFGGGDLNLYGYTFNNPVLKQDPLGLWIPQVIGAAAGAGFGAYTAYVSDPNASLRTIIQSAAVGAAAGLASTLPVPGLSLAVSGFTLGGTVGAGGNLLTQWLLPPSSCSTRIDWTSVAIAGVTGAVGGFGGGTLASAITNTHGMPLLTDLGQQAASAAFGGMLGGLLDVIYQAQYQAQSARYVTP